MAKATIWLIVLLCTISSSISWSHARLIAALADQRTSTTTTTETPASFIEDPTNSAATASESLSSTTTQTDDICLRCYDKVKHAQDLINRQSNLVNRQKKLISQKIAFSSQRSDEQETGSTTATTSQQRALRSTPTLKGSPNHRLVRSNQTQPQKVEREVSSKPTESNPNRLNYKDPQLRQLKKEQLHQLNVTCKALTLVQECLSELTRECIGNLQFHSHEVWSNQWHSKLNCPYKNNPNLRVFPGLRTTSFMDEQQERIPIPRRISSDEEVRKRLDQMFPGKSSSPLGVMLKPTGFRYNAKRLPLFEESTLASSVSYSHPSYQSQQRSAGVELVYLNFGRILLISSCFVILIAILVALTREVVTLLL